MFSTFGRDGDRALPHADQRGQRLARVVGAQIDAVVLVLEQELAAVSVVRVDDVDERIAEVRELEEQLLLHLLELAALDLEAIVPPGEAERVELLLDARTRA